MSSGEATVTGALHTASGIDGANEAPATSVRLTSATEQANEGPAPTPFGWADGESRPPLVTVGFTGTRKGLTPDQFSTVHRYLRWLASRGARTFCHGLCIGADEDAAVLATSVGYRVVALPGGPVGHPERSTLRCDVEFSPRPPLERNRLIVRASDIVLACPRGTKPQVRGSGTWATIRHCDKLRKPLVIIWPDGRAQEARTAKLMRSAS